MANKLYNKLKHDHEIIFNTNTSVEKYEESDIPIHPKLLTLEDVSTVRKDSLVGMY